MVSVLHVKLKTVDELLGGLSPGDWAQRISEDPRFLSSSYGLLMGRLRFLSTVMSQQELRGISLSSMARSNPANLDAIYHGYHDYLLHHLQAAGEVTTSTALSLTSLEALYVRHVQHTGR